jgi:putative intracellular protease/amidase
MAAKKILMLVGDYVEDYEVMVPFQALQMVGHTIKKQANKYEPQFTILKATKLIVKNPVITSL